MTIAVSQPRLTLASCLRDTLQPRADRLRPQAAGMNIVAGADEFHIGDIITSDAKNHQ
jgi:hypothetical protein